MMKFAAILLSALCLGQGVLARNSADQDPNFALYQYPGGKFLHYNAGFLYKKGAPNPNMKDRKGRTTFSVPGGNPNLVTRYWKLVDMNFEDFYREDNVRKDKFITVFPNQGFYRSFDWEMFSSEGNARMYRHYMKNRLNYAPRLPKASSGDFLSTANKNHIWFGKQRTLNADGTEKMKIDKKSGEEVSDKQPFSEPIATGFDIMYNDMDYGVWNQKTMGFACVDRRSFGGQYSVDSAGLPLNTKGVTGTGLKLPGLWRYSVNHAADPIVMRRVDEDTFEVIMIVRKKDGSAGIPGGMVDPGQTYGGTLLKELGEEAVKSTNDENQWKKYSADKQTEILTDYMSEHFDGLLLYKGYSDDDRNSDNAWVETTCVAYVDTTRENKGSDRLKLREEDTELHTSDTFWLTIKKVTDSNGGVHYQEQWPENMEEDNRFMFASHKFLIQDACRYADLCFKYENGQMVAKDDKNHQCKRRRDAFKTMSKRAQRETDSCQEKSHMASCCLWNDQYCGERAVKKGVNGHLKEQLRAAFGENNDMGLYKEYKEKWKKECEAPRNILGGGRKKRTKT